jgi:hypothetical protein
MQRFGLNRFLKKKDETSQATPIPTPPQNVPIVTSIDNTDNTLTDVGNNNFLYKTDVLDKITNDKNIEINLKSKFDNDNNRILNGNINYGGTNYGITVGNTDSTGFDIDNDTDDKDSDEPDSDDDESSVPVQTDRQNNYLVSSSKEPDSIPKLTTTNDDNEEPEFTNIYNTGNETNINGNNPMNQVSPSPPPPPPPTTIETASLEEKKKNLSIFVKEKPLSRSLRHTKIGGKMTRRSIGGKITRKVKVRKTKRNNKVIRKLRRGTKKH